MTKYILKSLAKLFKHFGYTLHVERKDYMLNNYIAELNTQETALIRYIYDNKLTMGPIPRLINTVKSCCYVVRNNIPGDFVECGVWRGGHAILAKKVFEYLGSDKKVWMFDTFEGMTKPTKIDKTINNGILAEKKFLQSQKENYNEWCYASLEDVKQNCLNANLNLDSLKFVKGDICHTLKLTENIPEKISVLRLDTDFYDSTKIELEVFYPKLCDNGVIIIDDYGRWEGSRKAVEEYFNSKKNKPLFNIIDKSCRSGIK